MRKMERLTEKAWRNLDPWECCGQENYCIRGCHEYGGCANGCMAPKTYKRLAEYEDTGLEPEDITAVATPGSMIKMASKILGVQPDRLRELVKAEKDGRLVVTRADVAPVRHGRWLDKGSLSCRCSRCGCKNYKETQWCPNCGARMDGDAE